MCAVSTSRPYHHGDLPAALLEAALGLLEDDQAFSLRAVARRAGVSPTAPYRHYADKEALLAALATDGFAQLAGHLEAAAELTDMAVAYVAFALAHPGLFRLMYGRPTADAASARTAEILASRLTDPAHLVRTTVAAALTPAGVTGQPTG